VSSTSLDRSLDRPADPGDRRTVKHVNVASDPGIAVVVPTYNEAANIPRLVERLAALRATLAQPLELWLMDDRGGDATPDVVRSLRLDWVHLVEREGPRGLGPAVMEGFERSSRDTVVVMDADLSHPAERIPELLAALDGGADMAFGSRYVPGASIDGAWSWFRRLNSDIATMLARPFVKLRDPMSGFFAIRRARVMQPDTFSQIEAIGYKIGLEIAVKTRAQRIDEIPIHFADRTAGESKLRLRTQLQYLVHLKRLALWMYPERVRIVLFCAVGGAGLVTYVTALTVLAPWFGISVGTVFSIAIAMFQNYVLNRSVTFYERRGRGFLAGFLRFAAVCSLGAVVNWLVTTTTARSFDGVTGGLQLAGVAGALAGLLFNYLGVRLFVFKRTRPITPG